MRVVINLVLSTEALSFISDDKRMRRSCAPSRRLEVKPSKSNDEILRMLSSMKDGSAAAAAGSGNSSLPAATNRGSFSAEVNFLGL